jgi:sulfite reductase (ferredoxin)
MDADDRQVEGFHVHLGGGLGLDPQFGRKLRAHKVTSAGLDDYVTNVVSAFLEQRTEDESFAHWVGRADEAALRGELGSRELEGVS